MCQSGRIYYACHLTQIMQEFLGSVLNRFKVKKVCVLIDELRVHGAIKELVVTQHVLEEGDICLQGKKQTKNTDSEIMVTLRNR